MRGVQYDEQNVFARILRREIPAEIVHEDERCVCFADVAPQAPQHLLVIPREPIARLVDAGPEHTELLGYLLVVAARVARERGVGDAFRVVVNNGEEAGQSVFHLHVHVLAGREFAWPPG
jgi:histidine triad (HIT) family protein